MIIKINNVDVTDKIDFPFLSVNRQLSNAVDTANFSIHSGKDLIPEYNDEVEIYDDKKIFGGRIIEVNEEIGAIPTDITYSVSCVDHTAELASILVSRTYENTTIKDIIDDMVSSFADTFTTDNVFSDFTVKKIVFNNIYFTQCLRLLAGIVQAEWFVSPDKDIHFFNSFSTTAPFNIEDGNYNSRSIKRSSDGTQVVNRVLVRGGEFDGELFTDTITVVGVETKSFNLPYKFANLTVSLNGTPQTVGIDFIDSFDDKDVLYNFQDQSINFETSLSDADEILFSGNPKTPVLSIAQDPESITEIGRKEKVIKDRSIVSNLVARRRASAELLTYIEPIVDTTLTTEKAGLEPGQLIVDGDKNMLVKSVRYNAKTPFEFSYNVELISTKRYELIDILRKVVAPENEAINENEVSEEIYPTEENLVIAEEYNVVQPLAVEDDLEVEESYFQSDTEPTWVLAPYTPTSLEDPKRTGQLDNSFKVY